MKRTSTPENVKFLTETLVRRDFNPISYFSILHGILIISMMI